MEIITKKIKFHLSEIVVSTNLCCQVLRKCITEKSSKITIKDNQSSFKHCILTQLFLPE